MFSYQGHSVLVWPLSRLGRDGRISSYHEMLLLIWRQAGEGGKLVSILVLVRNPYQAFWPRYPCAWAYGLSLTNLPADEELICILFTTSGTNSICSSFGGKLLRDKL